VGSLQYDRRAMAGFTGGSAWAMARDIAEGHVLVTERTLTRLKIQEMDKLQFELERLLRGVRGSQPPQDAIQEIRIRQRKLQRLTGAQRMLQAFLLRSRR
jgi:hypothetical protein